MIAVSMALALNLAAWGPQVPGAGWLNRVMPKDWPYLATDASFGTALFAKTTAAHAGSEPEYVQVLIRHEFRDAQVNPPRLNGKRRPNFRSEIMSREIDCTAGAYRSIKTSRYPRNNLLGDPEVFTIRNRDWIKAEADTLEETVVRAACPEAPTTGA